MHHYPSADRKEFPLSFVCTILSALLFAAAILIGVWIASVVYAHMDGILSIQRTNPYAGCDLAVEYAVRAARLCIPTVAQLSVCWIAAYVRFDKLLLAAVFFLRGIIFGTALHLSLLVQAEARLLLCVAVHGIITIIFLMTVFHIRTEEGLRSLPDSFTAYMIAGGLSCAAVILTTFFL